MSVTSLLRTPRTTAHRAPARARLTRRHARPRQALFESAALVGFAALLLGAQLWALQAAGLNIAEPAGGGALKGLINTLQSNWEWLIMTGVGLALAIVAGLVIFGSQRAPEHVFRIAGGIVMLMVVIPAILH